KICSLDPVPVNSLDSSILCSSFKIITSFSVLAGGGQLLPPGTFFGRNLLNLHRSCFQRLW
ncbi:hypothetical protein GOODEAATRI_030714, partial [Goodea atripinnis]